MATVDNSLLKVVSVLYRGFMSDCRARRSYGTYPDGSRWPLKRPDLRHVFKHLPGRSEVLFCALIWTGVRQWPRFIKEHPLELHYLSI